MTSIDSFDLMDDITRTLFSMDNPNLSWITEKYQSPEHTTSSSTISTMITALNADIPTAAINVASNSTSETMTAVQSESRTPCISPEPQRSQDTDQDTIWQVLINLDRLVHEVKNNHILLAAEIEDLMYTLEDHCQQLGIDPCNVCHLLILPSSAPITLTTRQTLHRACDDLFQDILRRKERIRRWVSNIITISENIREPSENYLETTMPPMSRARILQLENTYRTLEFEWRSRLLRFQSLVGMLRVRWIQCAYSPLDEYDHALDRLFGFTEEHDEAVEDSFLRIEPPLCLSSKCLERLSTKLADLDQNFYTRQSRVRAMEHVLGLIYQDLKTPIEKRVIFRDEATVRYSAELGRELKALQLELTARKIYQSGERWDALTAIWDTCLVNEQEREQFRSTVDQDDTTFSEKLERIQAEIETCRVRFSRSNAVYKLMMTRSKHIERMKSFEHSASDPKRLFRSSFQLVEEEKFRRRAYPTLLKLERTLIEAIDAFEKENGERFMYEGVPYYDTLQSEIEKRHVNETVFAKFTPVIAAPTRSQTIQIMGRPISPISKSSLSVPKSKPSQNSRNQSSATRSAETRRSNTLPDQTTSSKTSQKSSKSSKHEEDTNSNDVMSSLKPYLHSHQRETSGASTLSLSSTHSLKSKSSASSLTMTSAPVSASNSPKTEVVNHNGSYFTSFNTSTTNLSTSSVLSASSSSSSLSSLMSIPSVQVQPLPVSPKQELKTLSKSPSGVSINSTSLKPSIGRSLSPGKRVGV